MSRCLSRIQRLDGDKRGARKHIFFQTPLVTNGYRRRQTDFWAQKRAGDSGATSWWSFCYGNPSHSPETARLERLEGLEKSTSRKLEGLQADRRGQHRGGEVLPRKNPTNRLPKTSGVPANSCACELHSPIPVFVLNTRPLKMFRAGSRIDDEPCWPRSSRLPTRWSGGRFAAYLLCKSKSFLFVPGFTSRVSVVCSLYRAGRASFVTLISGLSGVS
jgi:hypothetical protein